MGEKTWDVKHIIGIIVVLHIIIISLIANSFSYFVKPTCCSSGFIMDMSRAPVFTHTSLEINKLLRLSIHNMYYIKKSLIPYTK